MANFTVNYAKAGDYKKHMEALRSGVATKQGGIFKVTPGHTVHEVTLKSKSGGAPVILLQGSDLYVIGFRNANGTFYFADHDPGDGSGTALKIGCSYTKAKCIGVLRDLNHKDATGKRDGAALQGAIDALDQHDGANIDDKGRVHLALITFSVSEALRFGNVFTRMQEVLGSNKSFSFGEFAKFVLNWERGSTAKRDAVLDDVKAADVHDALAVWKL